MGREVVDFVIVDQFGEKIVNLQIRADKIDAELTADIQRWLDRVDPVRGGGALTLLP